MLPAMCSQVTVHLKGKTECFECEPKPVPKSYPICTLRNTPDKPIHCIVWAKELLFQQLFGKPDAVTDIDERQAKEQGEDGAEGKQGDSQAEVSTPLGQRPASFVLKRVLGCEVSS